MMALTEDISLINHENPGKWSLTGLWSSAGTGLQGAKAKHWFTAHPVACLVPSTWSAPSDLQPLENGRQSLSITNLEAVGWSKSLWTHRQCPSGAGHAMSEALLWEGVGKVTN